MLDFFDPRTWVQDEYEHRIYSSWDLDKTFAIVDAIDYPFLSQFLWSNHDPKKLNHPYLKRGVSEFYAPDSEKFESPITGKIVRNRNRFQSTVFLHQEIMRRTGIPQPTPEHREVDHINRDVLMCRRYNLRWATRAEQNANRRS